MWKSESCLKWGGGVIKASFVKQLERGVDKNNNCLYGRRESRSGYHPCRPKSLIVYVALLKPHSLPGVSFKMQFVCHHN